LDQNSAEAQGITSSMLRFVCKDLRPVSMAEGEGFQGLMSEVYPKYEVSSQNTVASKTRSQASDIRKDVTEK
jgi:hypothetical protein